MIPLFRRLRAKAVNFLVPDPVLLVLCLAAAGASWAAARPGLPLLLHAAAPAFLPAGAALAFAWRVRRKSG